MSTGLVGTLSGIGKFFYKWSIRITKIFKHRMLTKRKSVLIFGEQNSDLYNKIFSKMQNNWDITRIYLHQPIVQAQPIIPEESKDTSKQIEVAKTQQKVQSFFKEYHLKQNYEQIQKTMVGKQFDSIVVLPSQHTKDQLFNFEDQSFATDYLSFHEQELLRNVFAYRLAHKYLTTTGVFILSASQRDFLKAEPESYLKLVKSFEEGNWSPSTELIDAQTTYLGVIVGERDYTDLNSWSLVALSREWMKQDPDFLLKYYLLWAESMKLPMPGSFALFKRRMQDQKKSFIEYI